jgi:hypothetical protein
MEKIKFMQTGHVLKADDFSVVVPDGKTSEGQITIRVGNISTVYRVEREALRRLHLRIGRVLSESSPNAKRK